MAISSPHHPSRTPVTRDFWLLLAGLALFLAISINLAWYSDDAYISARTSWNLAHGGGLTWNPGERVQSFTNPLWVFLGAAAIAITDEIFVTLLVLAILLNVVNAWLAFQLTGSGWVGFATVMLLAAAVSQMEHAVSGLENVASHTTLLFMLLTALRSREMGMTWRSDALVASMAALLILNRLDHGLIAGPLLLLMVVERPRHIPGMLLGGLPLIAWLGFATLYFGSPIPNTAFSKLYHAAVVPAVGVNGMAYALDSVKIDPLLAVVPLLLGIALWRGGRIERALALGAALHIAYVVKIGGDFMAGRFFSAAELLAIVLAMRCLPWDRRWPRVTIAMLLALGFLHPRSVLLPGSVLIERPQDVSRSTTDARHLHYETTGLIPYLTDNALNTRLDVQAGRAAQSNGPAVMMRGALGFHGVYAGDALFIIDRFALVDPFRSRFLPEHLGSFYRVGHASRRVPHGYYATLVCGENRLAEPRHARLYDDYRRILRDPLFDTERLTAIGRVLGRGLRSFGVLDPTVSEEPTKTRNTVQVRRAIANGQSYRIGAKGLIVHRCSAESLKAIRFTNSDGRRFRIAWQALDGSEIKAVETTAVDGLVEALVTPDIASRAARLHIQPLGDDIRGEPLLPITIDALQFD